MKSGNGKPPKPVGPGLKKILKRYKGEPRELISVLQDVQEEFRYLPEEALREVSRACAVPLTKAYGAATFYKLFRLNPPGEHTLTVCVGTACHVRGALRIVEEASNILGIAPGQTTPDRRFSFDTVNCLGCCAIGPVAVLDGKYYGQVSPKTIRELLRRSRTKKAVAK